jgi:hypothetical protein
MRTRQTLSALLGLAFVAGLGYALYTVLRLGAGLFDGLDRQTTVIVATAALTLLLAAWIVASGLHAIARRDETVQTRAARAAAYEALLHSRSGAVEGVFAVRGAVVPVDDSASPEQRLLLHASPAVLGAYTRLRRAEASGGAAHHELAELIRAMRRDLGQRAPDAPVAEIAELVGSPARERVG